MTVARPRYQQLKDLIIERISSGELQPSDRVPSENDLVESQNVSRMTANRALRELTSEGYVERVAGRGTFVSDYRSRSHLVEVHNIADEIERRGHVHSSQVVRQSRQRARGEVARALHVEQGTEVFHLLLVHYENGAPIQIEDRHVLTSFAPGCVDQDFESVTPSAYLTGVAPLQEAEQVVRASMPNAAVRQRLDIDDNEPCLVVMRRTWSRGRPVTFARLHHPGSRYELTGHYIPPGTSQTTSVDAVQLEKLRR
jgi:GntR family histidine utilization transcriptional repressor